MDKANLLLTPGKDLNMAKMVIQIFIAGTRGQQMIKNTCFKANIKGNLYFREVIFYYSVYQTFLIRKNTMVN